MNVDVQASCFWMYSSRVRLCRDTVSIQRDGMEATSSAVSWT